LNGCNINTYYYRSDEEYDEDDEDDEDDVCVDIFKKS
jgi:hypothetical protein